MAGTTALSNSPVQFTDLSGKQVSVPLSALFFDAQDTLKVDPAKWPPYATYQAQLDPWLKHLAASRLIVPDKSPPPRPALFLQSAVPGSMSNGGEVRIDVTLDPNPANSKFKAEVKLKQVYAGLSMDPASPSFIKTVLGTGGAAPQPQGIRKGLVQVDDAPFNAAKMPAAVAAPTALAGGGASVKASKVIKDAAAPTPADLFTLRAWKNGADGDLTQFTLTHVDPAAKTFTLTVLWTKTVQNVTLATLAAEMGKLAHAVETTLPATGVFAFPAPSTVVLSGGVDGTTPARASAVALAAR